MRILPGLTAPAATVKIKKGTFPVSTRILPTAGPVFTPLKTPTRTITNPILTGPFISTQDRSAAAKNVLTSVTQKPVVGPLVLPKPYVTPKPVVQKNLTPLVTPKPSVPFQRRPLVTPVEQTRMKAAAPITFPGRPAVTPVEQARMMVISNPVKYATIKGTFPEDSAGVAVYNQRVREAAALAELNNKQNPQRKWYQIPTEAQSQQERARLIQQRETWLPVGKDVATIYRAARDNFSAATDSLTGFKSNMPKAAGWAKWAPAGTNQDTENDKNLHFFFNIGAIIGTVESVIQAIKTAAYMVETVKTGHKLAAPIQKEVNTGEFTKSFQPSLTGSNEEAAAASHRLIGPTMTGMVDGKEVVTAGASPMFSLDTAVQASGTGTNLLSGQTFRAEWISSYVKAGYGVEADANAYLDAMRQWVNSGQGQWRALTYPEQAVISAMPQGEDAVLGLIAHQQVNAVAMGVVTQEQAVTISRILQNAESVYQRVGMDAFNPSTFTMAIHTAVPGIAQLGAVVQQGITATQQNLAVPVGQPVTTKQTVAPTPVRTAIPAQATASTGRILPLPQTTATQPAISSPVAPISTRQLPISTPTAATTQPVAQTTVRPAPSATTEPWQMTPDERQSKIAALQVQYKRELATPLMSEGNISPMQVGQMSKDQLTRFQQDGQTAMVVKAQIQDLEHPELAKVRFDQNVVAKNQEQITALQSRLGVLQQFGQRKNGMMRPSYQKEIDKVQAQLDTLVAPVTVPTPETPQTSPSAAISNKETGATTPIEITASQNAQDTRAVWQKTEDEVVGKNPPVRTDTRNWNVEEFYAGKPAPTNISDPFLQTKQYEFAGADNTNGDGSLLVARYLSEDGKPIQGELGQWNPVGEYQHGNVGIDEAYRNKGAGTAFVTWLMNTGRWSGPSVGYSPEGLATVRKAYSNVVEAARSEGKQVPVAPVKEQTTVTPPQEQVPAAKQPWEMTLDDIAATGTIAYDTKANHYIFVPGVSKIAPDSNAHFQAVRKAIAEGMDVPPNVLADYPDLKATAPAAVTPTVTTDPSTGLGTPEAWQTADKTDKIVATIDMNGLLSNSKQYGPDFGQTLRVIVAGAMQQEGIQGYGLNKIEVAALFPSQEEADAKMAAVQKVIEETAVNATVDGKTTTLTGWRLDYGTGDDKESADAALAASRTDLARSRWNVQPVRSPAGAATQRKSDPYAANLAVGIRPEASSQQQIAKNNATPWVAEGRQPTPRELLNGVVAMGYTLDESSRQMFDTKELNRLPMLQKLFRKSGTKVIGLDDLASRLFSEYGIDRPQGDLQDDDWLAQQLVAGASKGAGNATKDLFGGEMRTRAVAPTEAADTELFGKGQKAAFTTAQKNAAERGRHLQGQNQRTEQVRQAPVDEGILAGEVAGLPFDALNGNLGTSANVTGEQTNQPTTAGYEMNVTPPSGTTARTIAAENIQKVVLAVKDYVTTLASHPEMKATDYHAKLQERLKQLGVPAGLFTPTQILSMYQASKGPSRLWNLTNRVLLKLNAYNTAQTLLAEALNDVPSSVLTNPQKKSLQEGTLDNADFMRNLDFIDRELTKAQVTADLREKFDDMLAAEKEKAAIRLAKMSHRVEAAKMQAERDAAAKDAALKDKNARDKAVLQINRMLSSVAKNVQSGHTIKLDYVDTIRSIVSGLTKDNKLMADAARQMTTEQLQQLAGAIKMQVAVGRIVYMSDRAQREQTINDAVARVLPHITPMAGYLTKKLNHTTYAAVVSRYGRFRNAAATMGQGITPAETIHRMLGLREMYMDFLGGLTDARQLTDSWRQERLDKAKELGIATDLQQRRIGIWLINQTPGGRNHMIEGNKLTEQDIDSIVLTPKEQEYASFMRDHFDKNFPALRDYFRDFYNIEVTPVDAYTSLFNSSEFESDYEKAMKNLTFQNAVSGQRKTPKVGMAIKRTGGDNPVELNIFRIGDTYDDTMGYAIEFGPRLLKWWGVATNEEVMSKLGDLGNIYIRKNLVNLTYRGGPGGRTAESAMDKGADWLRRNLSRGQILLRPTSALLQALQISNVAGITGQNFVVKAGALLASDEKYGEWVKENFPLLRDSVRNYFKILGLPDDKLTQKTGAMFRWCHDAGRTTGALANYMYVCQQAGIAVDWDHPDKDLLLEAMVMVNQEFGSEDIVSLPAALETGYGFGDDKSLARLILQFQQDTLSKFDVLKTRIPGFKHKDARRAIRALFWMLLIGTGLVAGARYGYRKTLKAALGAKQQANDTYLAEYLKDIAEAVPFGNSIQSIFSYGDIPVPTLGTLVDAATQAKNLITYQGGYAKLRAGIRLATDIGSTLISAPGIGTIGQIAGYMVPSGNGATTSAGTAKPGKPTKPTVSKPHK